MYNNPLIDNSKVHVRGQQRHDNSNVTMSLPLCAKAKHHSAKTLFLFVPAMCERVRFD